MSETFADAGVVGQTWQGALAGFTPTDIGRGLRACLARVDTWPPTLPEFLALCRPVPVDENDWRSFKPDPAKMPGPKRRQWHRDNIAHVEAGGELPRDVPEPAVDE